MMIVRKSWSRWLAAASLAAVAALLPQHAPAQTKEVKVALVVPLSGPWARQGLLEREGAEMAIDDINAAGGIKALGGAKMKLIIADTGDTAEKAKNAAQRLVAQEPDLVGGVGAWLSTFTLAVTEVTERAQIPWLTLSYSDAITSRGFHYVFQTSATGDRQAELALPTIMKLAEAAGVKKPSTTAIVMDNTAAPVSFVKPMLAGGLQKVGLKLLTQETFTPPLSDATPLIAKVRALRPDFLFLVPTAVPDDSLLLQKMVEMGVPATKLPVVGNGAHLATPELLKVAGPEPLEDVLVTLANWSTKDQSDLIARYKKRTGEPWLGQDSLCAYGHFWILKDAIEKAGSADRRKVAEAIHAMDTSDGAAKFFAGGHIKFDAAGRRIDAPLVIVQWQKGVPVTVYPTGQAQAKPIWVGAKM
ncbi:MAG TPA: ABC transporter substrate-binding protein [Stellaceae bacterium]|nr:ABC transporter substrate-binding protein [Stellaceae bacterium]